MPPNDVYQDASTSMKEYVNNVTPPKHSRGGKKKLLVILLVVVLLAGGAAAYFLLKKPAKSEQQQPAQSAQTAAPEEPSAQVVTETESYVSQTFNLRFDYPKNWEVNDTINDRLIVMSPKIKLKDAAGSSTDGRVIIQIRMKGAKLIELPTEGSITAVRASEKMAYTQPSPAQRGETYLTFAQIKGSGLDAVYITGDNGYEKDAFVPVTDLAKADPLVSVSFMPCNTTACNYDTEKSLSVTESEWDTNAFIKQAKALMQSLTIS